MKNETLVQRQFIHFFFYRDNRRTRRKRLLRCCWAVPPIPSTGRIVSLHRKKRGFLPGVSDDVKMSVEHTQRTGKKTYFYFPNAGGPLFSSAGERNGTEDRVCATA